MTVTDETNGRPGSAADLSRRMDRLELNHEALTREVASLTSTVSRVEINQAHAEELNKLRFSALDTSVSNLSSDLKAFMARIEGMVSGEVDTNAARAGRELVADYQKWRREVDEDRAVIASAKLDELDADREQFAVLAGRLDLMGRLAILLVGGNLAAFVVALYAVVHP